GMAHWRLLELLNFIATELHKGFSQLFARPPEEWRARAAKKIEDRLALLAEKLGEKPYFTGNHFSIADAYVFVMLIWAAKFNIPTGKRLEVYYARVADR